MNAVLIINKPSGLTSHDVVNHVRRRLEQRSVGHLGTLDPLATGVLPLVIGSFTRLAQFYMGAEKTYEGTIRFGFSTDTYDSDGQASGEPRSTDAISLASLRTATQNFIGIIDQTPPPFSAKKINGISAYKLARKKQDVPLKTEQVEIKEFEITTVEGDRATFRARVASGTYMRAVAHDLGQQFGCGAHLETLNRVSVAEFGLDQSWTLDEVQSADADRLAAMFVHPRNLLPGLPSITADDETAAKIRSGRAVNLSDFSTSPLVKIFVGQRELIAVATRVAGTLFHAKTVLAAESSMRKASSVQKENDDPAVRSG
jgi:tRNA pseudouridine55 synthase